MGKILNREAAKRRQKSSDLSPFHGELCGDGGLHTCRLALTLVADVDFSLMGVKATLLDRPPHAAGWCSLRAVSRSCLGNLAAHQLETPSPLL